MAKARKKGLCALCGKGGALSFEHIPPQHAFNQPGLVSHSLEEWMQDEPIHRPISGGRIQPQGTGFWAFCRQCNHRTGEWYVPELGRWVRSALALMRDHLPSPISLDEIPGQTTVDFKIEGDARPQRLVKQIATMMFAVNSRTHAFRLTNQALAEYVLNRDSQHLPSQYRFYLNLFYGPRARFIGLCVSGNLSTHRVALLTEIAYPPFAYVMTTKTDPELFPRGDITELGRLGYDDVVSPELSMLVGFGHTPFPGDYRSHAAITLQQDKGI